MFESYVQGCKWVSNTCKLKHFSYFKDICKKSMAGIAKKLLMLYTCSQPVREREKKIVGVGVNEGHFTLTMSVSSHVV